MNIHEYQAKIILRKFGIPSSDFIVISADDDLDKQLEAVVWQEGVIKIQVHAGGRGKAGGVKVWRNRQELKGYTKQLLGMRMINNQTGPNGIVATSVLISPLERIKREFYLGAVIDRQRAQAMLIASPEGGVEIEEIALKYPQKILKLPITQDGILRSYNLLRLVKFMGWTGELAAQGEKIAQGIAKAFVACDASLIEINPLVETEQGKLVALDAKVSIDDNALFRQPEIAAYYDPKQQTPEEIQAHAHDLAYVALDGDIACMVNGAGLAMATMDIIQLSGGKPANFLDVGGGASREKVAAAFKIILADPKVKAILVNIFGGIMNCETLAMGIIAAASELDVKVPLVVRMEGTNVEQGKLILAESGLKIIIAETLGEAAKRVVELQK